MPIVRRWGENAPPARTLRWIADAIEYRRKPQNPVGGYLYGDLRQEQWTGYLQVTDKIRVNIKAWFSFTHDNMLEVEFLDDAWESPQMIPRTGRVTFRGPIAYPLDIKLLKDIDYEYYSFGVQTNARKMYNKQPIAFIIRRGGGPGHGKKF